MDSQLEHRLGEEQVLLFRREVKRALEQFKLLE